MLSNNKLKILAVASAGGHWVQLLRLRPAFEGHHTEFVSTRRFNPNEIGGYLHVVTDANEDKKLETVLMFVKLLIIIVKYRPNFIVTTGAMPGLIAIAIGSFLGIKTIWLDSIANSEQLSKSGRYAKKFASVWLTQWPHLSSSDGPNFMGSVL